MRRLVRAEITPDTPIGEPGKGENGYDQGAGFRRALEAAIDEVADRDLVFATAFHEWCALEADEAGTGWIRGLIEHARKRGVEVMSYADYWERTAARSGG